MDGFFTLPWIKHLIKFHLTRNVRSRNEFALSVRPPQAFKAFVKLIEQLGMSRSQDLILTDGFNEIKARMTDHCKKRIKERFPMRNLPKELERNIISSSDFEFKLESGLKSQNLSMHRKTV